MQTLFSELGVAIIYIAVGAAYIGLVTWFMMSIL